MRKLLPVVVATAIAAILAVPATYALLRGFDVLVRPPEPNPATVVWSAHIAMFWRLAIGCYIAGMTIPPVFMAAKANLARTIQVLFACVLVVAALLGVQGLLMP